MKNKDQIIHAEIKNFNWNDEVYNSDFLSIEDSNIVVRFRYENRFWSIEKDQGQFYLYKNNIKYSASPIKLIPGSIYIININCFKENLQIVFSNVWKVLSCSYSMKLHDGTEIPATSFIL